MNDSGPYDEALMKLLSVGQEWIDCDGDPLVIVSLDPGTMYPVQYRYDEGGTVGRDSIGGFFRDLRPPDFVGFVGKLATALAAAEARETAAEADNRRLRAREDEAHSVGLNDMLRSGERSEELESRAVRAEGLLELLRGRCVQLQREAVADRERVTRAEALLAEFELTDTIDNSGDLDGTPCDPWVMCLHCGGPEDECDLDGKCLGSRVRAHLRAHPAVAPAEPDGASEAKEITKP